MGPRFVWASEQVEEFFILLRSSYHDYLLAKELRRMDEFYEMLGSCIGADGLVVQNFLKKTGRAYRDILLQAETCVEGAPSPERKLRGSARVYALYEEYYQMYYLGSGPKLEDTDASTSFQKEKVTRLGGRKRKNCMEGESLANKRRILYDEAKFDSQEENAHEPHIDFDEVTDHVHVDGDQVSNHHLQDDDQVSNNHLQDEVDVEVVDHFSADEVHVRDDPTAKKEIGEHGRKLPKGPETHRSYPKSNTRRPPEEPEADGVFGKSTDFQERFLKLMENQNHILASIVDELNLIRHAVLDANGLQTITYIK